MGDPLAQVLLNLSLKWEIIKPHGICSLEGLSTNHVDIQQPPLRVGGERESTILASLMLVLKMGYSRTCGIAATTRTAWYYHYKSGIAFSHFIATSTFTRGLRSR